jgi:hypothetical protein
MEMSPQEKNAEIGAGRSLRPPERLFKVPIWNLKEMRAFRIPALLR